MTGNSINRRQAWQGLVAAAAVVSAPVVARAADPRPVMVIVTGVSRTMPVLSLEIALRELLSRKVRVGCAIDTTAGGVGMEIPEMMSRLIAAYPGQVEILAQVPDLWTGSSYFQLRRASEAQASLRRAFGQSAAPGALRTTILSNEPEENQAYRAIRAAGFRTALLQPVEGSGARGFGDTSGGVTPLFGGVDLATVKPSRIASAVKAELGAKSPAILYLPFADEAVEAGEERAALLGDAITEAVAAERAFSLLPSEMTRGSGGPRLIIVRVEPAANGAAGPAQLAFVRLLREAGIAASYGDTLSKQAGERFAKFDLSEGPSVSVSPLVTAAFSPGPGLAHELATGMTEMAAAAGVRVDAMTLLSSTPGIRAAASRAGISVIGESCGAPANLIGLGGNGLLDLPPPICLDAAHAIEAIYTLTRQANADGDAMIAIAPDAIETPGARAALSSILSSIVTDADNAFTGIAGYQATATMPDASFDLLKASRTDLAAANPAGDLTAAERAAYERDAEIAWRYISTQTNETTGLVAATTEMGEGGGSSTYPYMTMWDLGSLLVGIAGAHAVGLIDDAEFADRATKALGSIKDSKLKGTLVPQLLTSSDGKNRDLRGFDVSDTGRLLNCLYVLDQYSGGTLGIADIVGRWNFEKALADGRLHNYRGGAFVDAHESTYTNYIARGFTNWGLTVEPLFPEVASDSPTDAAMRVAERAVQLGPYGTEPHVLEEIELGYSQPARTLADMLYTAQQERYRETGRLTCVSEGPLNRAPWFTYQGYQLGISPRDEDAWSVVTVDKLSRYQTQKFRDAVEMISCKGAFLWGAVRREPYSQQLVDLVRAKAPTASLGYASGIYSATEEPTANYSDINTNGIILSTLAYILSGFRPMASLRMSPTAHGDLGHPSTDVN